MVVVLVGKVGLNDLGKVVPQTGVRRNKRVEVCGNPGFKEIKQDGVTVGGLIRYLRCLVNMTPV